MTRRGGDRSVTDSHGRVGHDHAEPPTRTGVLGTRTPGKLTAKRASRP